MATIKLPLLNAQDPVMNRYQTQLQSALAPITNSPINSAQQVVMTDPTTKISSPNVTLNAGVANIIPIGLSTPLQGWFLTRIKGNAAVWDSQDSNTTPSQTLILNTSATVVVQIAVF